MVGLSVLVWVLWRIDYDRMRQVVVQADIWFLPLVPLAIALEQLVRGWKWRQLLHAIRSIGTLRLFGAIMAGYFANIVAPLGISPIVRSWLVARLEALKMSTILATAAIDRFVDGVVCRNPDQGNSLQVRNLLRQAKLGEGGSHVEG